MHVGKKIKLLRVIRGMSQEELGEKVNRTRALISHIELTGKVHAFTLKSILKALDTTEEEFETFDDNLRTKSVPYTEFETKLTALEERLINYQKENNVLRDLVESQKQMIEILRKKKG